MLEEVKKRIEFYKQNKKLRIEGNYTGIPMYINYPKLATVLPVIRPGSQIMITANSGIGKSQTWIALSIRNIYKLKKSGHKVNVKVLIALLEDPLELFLDRLFSIVLHENFGIIADNLYLSSDREEPLSQEIEDKFDFLEAEVNSILEWCEVEHTIYNPTGLYKWARSISNKLGVHHTKLKDFYQKDGSIKQEEVYSHYIPNDNTLQVLMIIDNLNNLQREKDNESGQYLSERETINTWTRKYCRLQITKHWKFSVINILQQSSDSEKQEFNYKGNTIINRVKPSLKYIWKSHRN